MPTMSNPHGRNVRRGSRRYDAPVVEALPADVAALERLGFELVAEESSDERTDLESMSKAELLELAAAHDLEGRSSMSKAELVSALTPTDEQEA